MSSQKKEKKTPTELPKLNVIKCSIHEIELIL